MTGEFNLGRMPIAHNQPEPAVRELYFGSTMNLLVEI